MYIIVIKTITSTLDYLIGEVHSLKVAQQSQQSRNRSITPEPTGGYTRGSRQVLEEMSEEQLKTFRV